MDCQTLRDWVIRFNQSGPDGLTNIPQPGPPRKLDATYRAFLGRVVEEGPIPAVHGVVRWRACLMALLLEEFGVDDTIYRTLRDMGFAHLSGHRQAHRRDDEVMEGFKRIPAQVAKVRQQLGPGTPKKCGFRKRCGWGRSSSSPTAGRGTVHDRVPCRISARNRRGMPGARY